MYECQSGAAGGGCGCFLVSRAGLYGSGYAALSNGCFWWKAAKCKEDEG